MAVVIVDFMIKSKISVRNQDYITAIFKLCIQYKPEHLSRIEFLNQLPLQYLWSNIELLQTSKLFHSEALIYILTKKTEEAFLIWKSLCEGSLEDKYFPGFLFVIEQLTKLNNYQLLWQNMDWIMNLDQVNGVKVFTGRASDELTSERMRPDVIIDYLSNFKEALTIYLEYLIYEKNIKVIISILS